CRRIGALLRKILRVRVRLLGLVLVVGMLVGMIGLLVPRIRRLARLIPSLGVTRLVLAGLRIGVVVRVRRILVGRPMRVVRIVLRIARTVAIVLRAVTVVLRVVLLCLVLLRIVLLWIVLLWIVLLRVVLLRLLCRIGMPIGRLWVPA